jgi:hypothetical protein
VLQAPESVVGRASVWDRPSAASLTGVLKSELNGLSPIDPLACAGVLTLLRCARRAASVIPARHPAPYRRGSLAPTRTVGFKKLLPCRLTSELIS